MSASETLQGFLNSMAAAVVEGQFERYAQHVTLPFTLETATSTLRVVAIKDLEDGFDAYAEMLTDLSVTTIQRSVIRALSESPDTIQGQYTTRLLAGNVQVAPLFWSQIRLNHVNGIWKTSFIRNTTTDSRWPVLMPNVYRHQID